MRLGQENPNTQKANCHPTVAELAWAAGFLEGEGSFRLNGQSSRVDAAQKNAEPVQQLLRLFGGSVCSSIRDERVYFIWYATGARSRGVMYTLWPFMSDRRKTQIRQALCVS